MDYILQKALLVGVGIVIAIIIISAVLFTYNQIVEIYATVNKVDVSIVNIDDEYAKFDNNIMRGVEIFNAIKKYRRDKSTMIIEFNLVKNGSTIRLDNTKDWDTYINYFNGASSSYVEALSKTYTTTYTSLTDDSKVLISFKCTSI